jgi:hypothetical protein
MCQRPASGSEFGLGPIAFFTEPNRGFAGAEVSVVLNRSTIYQSPLRGRSSEEIDMRIDEALQIHGSKRVHVRGFLLRCDREPLRLCTELLESFPPQCAGPSLVVEGLDIDSLSDISHSDDCAWSPRPVKLGGIVAGGVLQVTGPVD